jgi:hypothetical protein
VDYTAEDQAMIREHRRILGTLLPHLLAEGLLDAVLAVEELLASQARHGLQRWRRLAWEALLSHLRGHLDEVELEPAGRDHDTGHLSAAHLAARALMTLARALERMR